MNDLSTTQNDAPAMRAHAAPATRILKALANERRLMILCALVEGERNVGDLNAQVEISQSAVSQHLALLREEGVVEARREGQLVYYRLRPGPVQTLLATLQSIYCRPLPG